MRVHKIKGGDMNKGDPPSRPKKQLARRKKKEDPVEKAIKSIGELLVAGHRLTSTIKHIRKKKKRIKKMTNTKKNNHENQLTS